ncbi:leucine-rich repeat-containing protein [Tanacetum coccineum]
MFASSSSSNNIHKCHKKQSEALLLFKLSSSHMNQAKVDNDSLSYVTYLPTMMSWNTSTDCCIWNGVTCDRSTGDVIGIDLGCGMLSGTFHPNSSLFNLPHLQTLNLAFNDFDGFQIPSEIGRFSNSLTHLNLSYCGLSGQVPPDITLLHKLVSLDLSANYDLKLEPHVFINMLRNFTNLEELSLAFVNISSVLPTSLNISSSLKLLNLAASRLQGKLPHYIFNLQSLETLDLSGNPFTGDIPSKIPVNLTHMDLSFNNLNGTLPSWLFTSPSLEYLDLRYNMFSGNVPFESFALPSLKRLDLGLPQFQWYGLGQLYLQSNLIEGPFPPSICNMSGLGFLDMSHNSFDGVIPQCVGNISNSLQMMDLGNNSFQGTIPNVFEEFMYLEGLILNGNQLEGGVPVPVPNVTIFSAGSFLNPNNFHGNIQPSFAVKSPFPGLQVLDLSHNSFVGQLPTKYFQNFNSMKNVVKDNTEPQYLYMGRGKYYSFVVAMKGMDQDVPKIFLNGRIPDSLGKLSEIVNIKNLFFRNQLTGNIPQSLAGINGLEVLDLSQNHLVGRIPEGTHFTTFDESSFAGNLELCGFQLPKKCSDRTHKPQLEEHENHEDKSGFTWEVVTLGYGCGTLLGLVMGYLMLSTRKIIEGKSDEKADMDFGDIDFSVNDSDTEQKEAIGRQEVAPPISNQVEATT